VVHCHQKAAAFSLTQEGAGHAVHVAPRLQRVQAQHDDVKLLVEVQRLLLHRVAETVGGSEERSPSPMTWNCSEEKQPLLLCRVAETVGGSEERSPSPMTWNCSEETQPLLLHRVAETVGGSEERSPSPMTWNLIKEV